MRIVQVCLFLLFTPLYKCYNDYNDEENSVVELQLADYDLLDAFDEISEASLSYLLNKTTNKEKILLEKNRGELLRLQSLTNREIRDVPYELLRNWTLLTKPGDILLPQKDYDALIDFSNQMEALPKLSKILINSTMDKRGYDDALHSRKNISDLMGLWYSWQNIYLPSKSNFSSILKLLNNAHKPNEANSVKSYWEMLTEYENGYDEAQKLWTEVEPLYKLLLEFVKVRIHKYYNINTNDSTIPVYLLGSNFGTDWSNIADIVLPHLHLYTEIQEQLKGQSVKSIFKLAEKTTKKLGLGGLGKAFWKDSRFNHTNCEPHLFSQCGKKYTQVITCNKLDLTTFMDIHESAMDIVLRNQDYSSLPRRDLRFSAVDEALYCLGSVLALDNLPAYNIIPKDSWTNYHDEHDRKNTALLITALRVLPKLPYYLLSDTTRLDQLENSKENFTEAWWLNRIKLQGVHGKTNEEVDFLGDASMSSNKPQLSKYFGIFLQFQLIEYYKNYFTFENGSIADFINSDDNFRKFIQDRPNKNWIELLNYYYTIDKITSESLLNYFKPLENYLKEAPLEQIITIPKRISIIQLTTQVVSNTLNNQLESTTEIIDANSQIAGSSKVTVWIILGMVAGLVLVALIVFIVRRSKRRKGKNNNRRFET